MDESFEDIERKEGRGFRGRAVFLRAMEWVWKEFGRGSREAQIREGTGKLPVGITQAREQPLGRDCQMESSDRPSLGCAGSNHSAVFFDPATCPWTPTGICRWLCLTLLLGFFFFLPFLHRAAGTPSLYGLPCQTSTSALRFISTVPNAFYIGILEMRRKAVWPDGNCTWPSWFLTLSVAQCTFLGQAFFQMSDTLPWMFLLFMMLLSPLVFCGLGRANPIAVVFDAAGSDVGRPSDTVFGMILVHNSVQSTNMVP